MICFISYVTFGLDEFSSKMVCVFFKVGGCFILNTEKKVCVTSRSSPIDDWMSFPVKRSQKYPRKLPIRVKAGVTNGIEMAI